MSLFPCFFSCAEAAFYANIDVYIIQVRPGSSLIMFKGPRLICDASDETPRRLININDQINANVIN